jgi:regulator of cell morphogenesis and NO signaling
MILLDQTVAEIARENPAALRVFEKYRIDYCCGGKDPLAAACTERGLSAQELVAEIEIAGSRSVHTRDWATAPLEDLIRHIVATHHVFLAAELPRLETMLAKVIGTHAANHPELKEMEPVFRTLKNELVEHMAREEMILFPAILRGEKRLLAIPISVMEREHASAGRALATLRALSKEYTAPDDACNTFRGLYKGLEEVEQDLHLHIHLENNILFPRAQFA